LSSPPDPTDARTADQAGAEAIQGRCDDLYTRDMRGTSLGDASTMLQVTPRSPVPLARGRQRYLTATHGQLADQVSALTAG
jgi:hypothetical protein